MTRRHPDTVLLAELEDLLAARRIADQERLVDEAWLAAARAGHFDLDPDQPETVQLGPDRPDAVPLGSDQPETVPLGPDRPDAVQSGSVRTEPLPAWSVNGEP